MGMVSVRILIVHPSHYIARKPDSFIRFTQDGCLEVIDGTLQDAFNVSLTTGSKSELERLAEAREEQPGKHQHGANALSDLTKQINWDDGDGSDYSSEGDDVDDALEELREMMENYEERQHAHSNDGSDEGIARQAASELIHDDGAVEHTNDQWAEEQKTETSEAQRSRVEMEVASKLLTSGVKVQGQQFLQIAENAMAES